MRTVYQMGMISRQCPSMSMWCAQLHPSDILCTWPTHTDFFCKVYQNGEFLGSSGRNHFTYRTNMTHFHKPTKIEQARQLHLVKSFAYSLVLNPKSGVFMAFFFIMFLPLLAYPHAIEQKPITSIKTKPFSLPLFHLQAIKMGICCIYIYIYIFILFERGCQLGEWYWWCHYSYSKVQRKSITCLFFDKRIGCCVSPFEWINEMLEIKGPLSLWGKRVEIDLNFLNMFLCFKFWNMVFSLPSLTCMLAFFSHSIFKTALIHMCF